jgi:hypothetical protein
MTNIEQEKWTITFGIKTANTIPYRWVATEFQNQHGPVWCQTCRKEGSFEGVFYASCPTCCSEKGSCSCVYCHVAKKDGHQHLMKRANIFKFVKELQTVIADLKRDYPEDEYGIVKEGIETGFYILNLHTAKQYELMLLDITLPFEVSQLSNEDLTYRWNPEREVPDNVIRAAVKAAKRLNIVSWAQALWSGTKYESSHVAEEFTPEEQRLVADFDKKQKYLRPLQSTSAIQNALHEEKDIDIIACDNCCAHLTTSEGDLCHTCLEAYMQNAADYETQCLECETWVTFKETDKRGYCLDCQNPEYDPAWPMGL